MSSIQFIKSPFPDNHNGFDYTPKSFTDVQRELDSEVLQNQNAEQQNKLMSMLSSIFK